MNEIKKNGKCSLEVLAPSLLDCLLEFPIVNTNFRLLPPNNSCTCIRSVAYASFTTGISNFLDIMTLKIEASKSYCNRLNKNY